MLITILVANRFKLANHLLDSEAMYLSSLEVKNFTSKRGLAQDKLNLTATMTDLRVLSEAFFFLTYDTPIKVYLDTNLVLDGYVEKVSTDAKDKVKFSVASLMTPKLVESMTPKLSATCQNQIYSKMCSLDPMRNHIQAQNVEVNCLTGFFEITLQSNVITMGSSVIDFTKVDGNLALYDGNLSLIDYEAIPNDKFYDLTNWTGMIVIINNSYRSAVTKIEGAKVYLALNYVDAIEMADTIDLYLPCDKTYGICDARFSNTNNFWGFPNTGGQVKTVDIFSADNLTYCGSDEAVLPQDNCSTDDLLFGVEI